MTRKFCAPVVLLAVTTFCLAVSPRVFATPVTVNFTCGAGSILNGTPTTGSNCPTGNPVITAFTENGFTVTPYAGTTWEWGPNEGNAKPDIKTGIAYGTNTATNTVKFAETSGGLFQFNSVDLQDTIVNKEMYTIIGYLTNGTQVFDISCSVASYCNPNLNWQTISSSTSNLGITDTGNMAGGVNYVLITLTDPNGNDRLDNFDATPIPEPTSLLLLGTGLLGLGGVIRRKLRA